AKRLRAQQGYEDTMNLMSPIMSLAKTSFEFEMNEKNPILYRLFNSFKEIKEKCSKRHYS
ncbi:MAG: patatin-like phospholipase family protein, partial [Clostridium perfringens]|nr:patatin-like phospholipase family protein [Clostridium perfringens]